MDNNYSKVTQMDIDLSKLEKMVEKNGDIIARCPACAEAGQDKTGNHFFMNAITGKYGCVVNTGPGGEAHRKRIFALIGTRTEEAPKPEAARPPIKRHRVASWDYVDPFGVVRFRVERWEPSRDGKKNKDFSQLRPDGKGGWIYDLDGVERCLFNWPAIIKSDEVWIVEGEGKADILNDLGFCATTCAMGAGKWCAAYSNELRGKRVVLCPDNDEPGQAHAKAIHESLIGICSCLLRVKVPEPYNDIKNYLPTFATKDDRLRAVCGMLAAGTEYTKGIDTPIRSMEQLEHEYRDFIGRSEKVTLNIAHWLPTATQDVRPVRPGDVVVFLAATGVGKTILLQNMAINASPLSVLLFELELPGVVTFERFAAMATRKWPDAVESEYIQGRGVDWKQLEQLKRVFVSSKSGLSIDDIRTIYNKAELVIGERPPLVMLDYIQLVRGIGGSRYEKVSNIAEDIKTLAKDLNVILVLASQVHREVGEDQEVFLHDGKDSGSIENSAGLVFGVWHPANEQDDTILHIRMLKQNKGRRRMQKPITCKIFEGLLVKEVIDEQASPR